MLNPLQTGPSELSVALTSLNWAQAEAVVKAHPQQASQWSMRQGFFEGVRNSHCLPLHEACVLADCPVSTVKAILCANLAACRTRESSYRRLPLHCACRRRPALDIQVLKALLQAYAPACLVPDDLGRLPLHYALSNGASQSVVQLLLQTHPQAAQGVDNRGWTPLHVACSTGASLSIIQSLIQLYPEAVILHTKKGSTPVNCLPKDVPDRQKIKQLIKNAREEFDKTFVDPLNTNRKTLLEDNHDVLLV